MTNEKFNSIVPIWNENPSLTSSIDASKKPAEIDTRQSKWVGGSVLVEKDLSDLNQGSNNQLPVRRNSITYQLDDVSIIFETKNRN
jgi:hypothetical protein